jgi:hypothetical protein
LSSAHDSPIHCENVGKGNGLSFIIFFSLREKEERHILKRVKIYYYQDPVMDVKWSALDCPVLVCGHDEGSFVHHFWSGKHLSYSFESSVWVNFTSYCKTNISSIEDLK